MTRLIEADALRAWFSDHSVYDEFPVGYIMGLLDEQPTVEAVPVRHGKWMGTVCSACGESTSFYYDCDYCPHCGARMDKK